MSEYTLYWVWLTLKSVISPSKITSLLEYFGTIKNIYDAKSYNNIPNIGAKEIAALKDKSTAAAKGIINKTAEHGAQILTYDDEKYPKKLLNISPPPYVLYIRGQMLDIDNILTIAIVGTRRCSAYGKLAASRLTRELASNGVVTVSGMARGIDSIAARSALAAGAKTIAVIGNGLDTAYPPENAELMERIAENGMVVSEYPIGAKPLPHHFPERNRIIAGLSNGVLVAEAPKSSGSLITARFAAENGRDVFAVPGNILEDEYLGSNMLIQDGAKLVINASDILNEYPYMKSCKPSDIKSAPQSAEDAQPPDNAKAAPQSAEDIQKAENTQKTDDDKNSKKSKKSKKASDDGAYGKACLPAQYEDLNAAEQSIVALLTERDMQTDELVRELDITPGELNVKITLLEVKGIIKRLPGGLCRLKV